MRKVDFSCIDYNVVCWRWLIICIELLSGYFVKSVDGFLYFSLQSPVVEAGEGLVIFIYSFKYYLVISLKELIQYKLIIVCKANCCELCFTFYVNGNVKRHLKYCLLLEYRSNIKYQSVYNSKKKRNLKYCSLAKYIYMNLIVCLGKLCPYWILTIMYFSLSC